MKNCHVKFAYRFKGRKDIIRFQTDLIDVGQVSVDATVNEAKPTANTTLKAASTPMTASGDFTAASVSISKLHNKRDIPVEI
jgi:hypothetical protein